MAHAHLGWCVRERIPYLILPVRQLTRERSGGRRACTEPSAESFGSEAARQEKAVKGNLRREKQTEGSTPPGRPIDYRLLQPLHTNQR